MPCYIIDLGELMRLGFNFVRYLGPYRTQAEAHEKLKEIMEKWAIPPDNPSVSVVDSY